MAEAKLKNPYKGINAHLNSRLQTPGTIGSPSRWHGFHASHIGDIANALNEVLPANYVARPEESLQIFGEDFEVGSYVQTRRPDISIYSTQAAPVQQGGVAVAEAVAEISLSETLYMAEEFQMSAIVIRDVSDDPEYGHIVTRIELLSPSNKPGDSGYEAYNKGRNEALYSHIPLIEIDYLHETALPLNYRRARAYYVVISDPRPDIASGKAKLHGFGVDVPFPVVKIPLAGSETLSFDFGTVYQQTFERGRWGRMIDYTSPPLRFETYSKEDQERIEAVMKRVTA